MSKKLAGYKRVMKVLASSGKEGMTAHLAHQKLLDEGFHMAFESVRVSLCHLVKEGYARGGDRVTCGGCGSSHKRYVITAKGLETLPA